MNIRSKAALVSTVLFAGSTMLSVPMASASATDTNDPWEKVPDIKEQINPPEIPDRNYNVLDYGVDKNEDGADISNAIETAIEDADDDGGGRIVIPEGTYETGPIHFEDNINLHIQEGATLQFSDDPDDYLPAVKTRWEGVELYNYSPLIYAHDKENIAITGNGVLDGQATTDNWWPWKGKEEDGWEEGEPNQDEARDRLFQMAEDGVPVKQRQFGNGDYLRPSFIQPYESENILIKDVSIKDSPMWFINPVLSENITIDNVDVEGHGPNNDGVDPESSKNVWIKNSSFNNGDDNIAIKSGRNEDGRRIDVPSENIIIENNKMLDGHGAVVVGSEMTGGAKNIFAQNNTMDSPNLDRVLRIKTNSIRGGVVENVYLRDNIVNEVGGEVVRINMFYEEGDAGEHTPTIRNIGIDNLQSQGGDYGIYVRAYERSPIENFSITNSSFEDVDTPTEIENVKNMTLKNFTINGESYDNSAPSVEAKFAGEQSGKHANVKIKASDNDGIDQVRYRLNDGDWKEYTSKFKIQQSGRHELEYQAIDKTGNRSNVFEDTVNISK